jgi:hypothetical protein
MAWLKEWDYCVFKKKKPGAKKNGVEKNGGNGVRWFVSPSLCRGIYRNFSFIKGV